MTQLYLWFSEKMRENLREMNQWTFGEKADALFGKLEDGSIQEYTSARQEEGQPISDFNDWVFVGIGHYHHREPLV